jgi:hypothetical protein
MEDIKQITAEWARKTTETQLGIQAKAELDYCLGEIKKAVGKNQMSVNIYEDTSTTCDSELKKRGFKIEIHCDPRDGNFMTISW